jgi:4-hydroxybenzoate polyprenyltransferase
MAPPLVYLRLCRLQFALLPAGSIGVGYLAAGGGEPVPLLVFVAAAVAAHAASALFNAYSDHEEDRVNMPQFAALVEAVGRRRCLVLALELMAGLTLLAVAGLFLYPLPSLLQILLSALIAAYSLGPRLKARTLGSLAVMALHVGWPFWLGWMLAEEAPYRGGWPMALLLGLSYALSRTVRSVHDVEGDRQAGVETWFSRLGERRAWHRFLALFLAPWAVLAALVAAGLLPPRLLLALLWVPCAAQLARLLRRTHTALQHAALFDWSTLYTTAVHFTLLALFLPRPGVIAACGGAVLAKVLLAHFGLDYRTHLPLPALVAVRFAPPAAAAAPEPSR